MNNAKCCGCMSSGDIGNSLSVRASGIPIKMVQSRVLGRDLSLPWARTTSLAAQNVGAPIVAHGQANAKVGSVASQMTPFDVRVRRVFYRNPLDGSYQTGGSAVALLSSSATSDVQQAGETDCNPGTTVAGVDESV